MKQKFFALLLVSVFLLAACAPLQPSGLSVTATVPAQPATAVPTSAPAPTSVPTVVPTTVPTQLPVDLTPAQRAAIQAAAKAYNVPVESIKIISTEAVTWPSGCLGVVLPGKMCTQNQVEGFRIIMEAKGERFEFHTNQDGQSVLDAAQQLATLRLVVLSADGTIKLASPSLALGPTYNPAFTGFLAAGGSTAGTAYVLNYNQQSQAVAIDDNGQHALSFVKNPNYGLALWRGGMSSLPMLAWGTQPMGDKPATTLNISALDGSDFKTLLTQEIGSSAPVQLVAEFWSADGKSLYFSKEPYGIGGYILFGGGSNLYKIDIATLKVTEIIPQGAANAPMVCLDALSGDYRLVAEHCSQKNITIRDLSGGKSTTILPPAEVKGFQLVGSARFSPDGSRVAFAMAKNNPDAEQGWVAVSDGVSGGSKLILTGKAGASYNVVGWLSDQTVLVQVNAMNCSMACTNELWTVNADGSNATKVADGTFMTILDNK